MTARAATGERIYEMKLLLGRGAGGAYRFGLLWFVHPLFQFILYIVLGIVELTDTAAQSTHEFGYLTSAEHYEHCNNDQEPLTSAGHRQQKDTIQNICNHNQ